MPGLAVRARRRWTAAGRRCRGSRRTRPPRRPTPSRTARSFTFQTMHKWGVTDRADDVAAVVTELLTNAIRHAVPQAQHAAGTLSPWPIKVGLLHPGSHVICAIADPSTELPELRARLAGRVRPRAAGGVVAQRSLGLLRRPRRAGQGRVGRLRNCCSPLLAGQLPPLVRPAAAAVTCGRRGRTRRRRRWRPPRPFARQTACHTAWSAAGAGVPSARLARRAG